MHRHKLERDDHLYKAFQYFDKDSSGYVLHLALGRWIFYLFTNTCQDPENISSFTLLPNDTCESYLNLILLSSVYLFRHESHLESRFVMTDPDSHHKRIQMHSNKSLPQLSVAILCQLCITTTFHVIWYITLILNYIEVHIWWYINL